MKIIKDSTLTGHVLLFILWDIVDRKNKQRFITLGLAFVLLYFFIAPRPIPKETVLLPVQFNSLESTITKEYETDFEAALIPFNQNNHVGYINYDGIVVTNQVQKGYVSLSQEYWADYEPVPDTIEIKDPYNNIVLSIKDLQGYPFFLDKRIFIVGPELQSLQEINPDGSVAWTYSFAAPITTFDAAAGLIAAGSLDGTVELLDDQGRQIFSFIPGGSRLSIITGCALSQDGSKLAITSGIDQQRFLFLERLNNTSTVEYKVVYHEFLSEGLRKAMYVEFVDNDGSVIFEREGGLGVYNMTLRRTINIPLEGDIVDLNASP